MSVTYKFRSLSSFADWCENKSRELDNREPRTKADAKFTNGESYAWFMFAEMLRNTVIEPDGDDK